MARFNSLAVALALAFGAISSALVYPKFARAEEKTKVVLSEPVAKPLKAAQDAIKRKQWKAAHDQIKQAQAFDKKTPQDEYSIDKLLAYVLYQEKNYAAAAPVYERLIASPLTPANEVDASMKAVAEMYYRASNYPEAINWSKKYLDKHPNDETVREVLGESYFRTKDYKQAAATMQTAVAHAEQAKQTPKESWLRVLQNCYYRLDDTDNERRALLKLVRYFQKPEDWNTLLSRYSRQEDDHRVLLGYHRLMLDFNLLSTPQDYEDMALEALDAGVPAEAQRVIEQGIAKGVFKQGETLAGRHERLLAAAKERSAQSRAALPQKAKEAANSPQGQDDLDVGRLYLSYGEDDAAITALKRALQQGDLKDPGEAHVVLGMVYAKEGDKNMAEQAFKKVPKDSKWSTLAQLWSLRVAGGGQQQAG